MERLVIENNEHLRDCVNRYFLNEKFRKDYPIGTWITSAVTDMSKLFKNKKNLMKILVLGIQAT